MRNFIFAALMAATAPCVRASADAPTAPAGLAVSVTRFTDAPPAPADLAVFSERLRTHCRACHGVGELRFIYDDDDARLWRDLFDPNAAPGPGGTWAQRIVRVLSWPSDAPPPFNQMMDPPNRDWMPRGAKRLRLAEDRVGDTPARRFLLSRLESQRFP